jgi:predicted deacylase
VWLRGKTAIGCEYLGAGQLSEAGSAAYVRGILSCLAHWDILQGGEVLPEAEAAYENDWQLADADGIFHARREIGTTVKTGEVVGVTTDLRGNVAQEFIAAADGVVLGLRSKAWLRKGDWGVLLGALCRREDHD